MRSPALRCVVWFVVVVATGCGKRREPTADADPPAATPPAAQRAEKRPQPAAETRQPTPAPEPVRRSLTTKAARELSKDFHQNPVAAKRSNTGVRWRFALRVFDFEGFNTVRCGISGVNVSGCEVQFASEEEVAKMRRNEPVMVEAELDEWAPGIYYGTRFRSGVVIGPPPPPPAPAEAGERELDSDALKLLIAAFDENEELARNKFRPATWRFTGKVVQRGGDSWGTLELTGHMGTRARVHSITRNQVGQEVTIAAARLTGIQWDQNGPVLEFQRQ